MIFAYSTKTGIVYLKNYNRLLVLFMFVSRIIFCRGFIWK